MSGTKVEEVDPRSTAICFRARSDSIPGRSILFPLCANKEADEQTIALNIKTTKEEKEVNRKIFIQSSISTFIVFMIQ
jgi:hypothetical protein